MNLQAVNMAMRDKTVSPTLKHIEAQWPLLLTWFNFNPSMDK